MSYIAVVVPTAILILTKNSFFNRYILSTKLLLMIGDISYPFYLWHSGLMGVLKSGNGYIDFTLAIFFANVSAIYV